MEFFCSRRFLGQVNNELGEIFVIKIKFALKFSTNLDDKV
jgi:hypothetical protein